jgi:HSP20 family protein
MLRAKISNHAFDRMGERYAPLIDPYHFLGQSAFDIPYAKKEPSVNVLHKGPLFILEVAVPGFKKEELEIIVDNEVMTIRGEKTGGQKRPDLEYIIEEFERDGFERKFKLARRIASEKINAVYENGLLRITFVDVPVEEEKSYQNVMVE